MNVTSYSATPSRDCARLQLVCGSIGRCHADSGNEVRRCVCRRGKLDDSNVKWEALVPWVWHVVRMLSKWMEAVHKNMYRLWLWVLGHNVDNNFIFFKFQYRDGLGRIWHNNNRWYNSCSCIIKYGKYKMCKNIKIIIMLIMHRAELGNSNKIYNKLNYNKRTIISEIITLTGEK